MNLVLCPLCILIAAFIVGCSDASSPTESSSAGSPTPIAVPSTATPPATPTPQPLPWLVARPLPQAIAVDSTGLPSGYAGPFLVFVQSVGDYIEQDRRFDVWDAKIADIPSGSVVGALRLGPKETYEARWLRGGRVVSLEVDLGSYFRPNRETRLVQYEWSGRTSAIVLPANGGYKAALSGDGKRLAYLGLRDISVIDTTNGQTRDTPYAPISPLFGQIRPEPLGFREDGASLVLFGIGNHGPGEFGTLRPDGEIRMHGSAYGELAPNGRLWAALAGPIDSGVNYWQISDGVTVSDLADGRVLASFSAPHSEISTEWSFDAEQVLVGAYEWPADLTAHDIERALEGPRDSEAYRRVSAWQAGRVRRWSVIDVQLGQSKSFESLSEARTTFRGPVQTDGQTDGICSLPAAWTAQSAELTAPLYCRAGISIGGVTLVRGREFYVLGVIAR